MHDEVAFGKLVEIDLCATPFRTMRASAWMGGQSSKQFSGREDDEIGPRKTKSMRERSFEKIDIIQRLLLAHHLAEALDFPFSLKVDDYLCLVRAPLLQARAKLRAFRFDEHEIADRELTDFGRRGD